MTGIACLAGRRLSREAALAFIGALGVNGGAGLALRERARGLSKRLVPHGGSLVSAGAAYWGTYGLGQARKLLEHGRETILRKP